MQSHSGCTFLKLEATFCKHYRIIQNDKQVYMDVGVIQQGSDEMVEVYYEQILKLTDYLQHKKGCLLVDNLFPSWVGPLFTNCNCKNEMKHLI